MIRLLFILGILASPAMSQTVVAARTIPAQSLIGPEDLALRDGTVVGRPIRAADVGFPAVIERNQIVPLRFKRGGVTIATEGRSLGRAGPGETVRIMNLASRSTVSARVGADGVAYVSQ